MSSGRGLLAVEYLHAAVVGHRGRIGALGRQCERLAVRGEDSGSGLNDLPAHLAAAFDSARVDSLERHGVEERTRDVHIDVVVLGRTAAVSYRKEIVMVRVFEASAHW